MFKLGKKPSFLALVFWLLTFSTNSYVIRYKQDSSEVLRVFPLSNDQVWPEDVAHLFSEERKEEEEEEGEEDFNGKRTRRSKKKIEWTGEWPQRWSDEGNATLRNPHPKDDSFIFYFRPEDQTYVMSRCTSTVGAPVLTLACPQPRGYKYHRVLDLKNVYYGWSMTQPTCQYIEGDCIIPYEFMHKQIMRPNLPTSQSDFYSVGPTFFCNEWDGGGRKDWVLPAKMTCTVGARRSTSATNPEDDQANPFGRRFGYAWQMCGTGYDWFDFIQAEYKCRDVMEPLSGADDVPEEFFSCETRAKKLKEEKKLAAELKAKQKAEENEEQKKEEDDKNDARS